MQMRSEVDAGHDFIPLAHSVAGHSTTSAANVFLNTATEAQQAHFKHFIFVACFLDSARLALHLWVAIGWDLLVDAPQALASDSMVAKSPEDAQPFADALIANRASWPPDSPISTSRFLARMLCNKRSSHASRFTDTRS